MTNRKSGWYFISWSDEHRYEVAEWDAKIKKWRQGNDIFRGGYAIVEQRIPTPDEPWKCVPRNYITEEMRRKALRYNDFNDGGTGSVDEFNSGIYFAMLSAAPKPEDT